MCWISGVQKKGNSRESRSHWAGGSVKRRPAVGGPSFFTVFLGGRAGFSMGILTSYMLSWACARSSSPRHKSVWECEEVE